jgi:hypothetical protein
MLAPRAALGIRQNKINISVIKQEKKLEGFKIKRYQYATLLPCNTNHQVTITEVIVTLDIVASGITSLRKLLIEVRT